MRYLALDVGDRRIGVAVSDPLGLTAQGLDTIQRTNNKAAVKAIVDLMTTYETQTLIIGLPKNMNGTEGERCDLVRAFADKIRAVNPSIEIKFWDERLSTVAATKTLVAADVSRAKRKRVIDKMAAVHILEGFMQSVSR